MRFIAVIVANLSLALCVWASSSKLSQGFLLITVLCAMVFIAIITSGATNSATKKENKSFSSRATVDDIRK